MAQIFSNLDSGQIERAQYSDAAQALKVIPGFLVHAAGRKIELSQTATTDVWTYKETGGSTLFVITVTYTDASKETIESVERTT
jgi:hypothetical protein